jgi:hypothetical protein
MIKWKEFFKYLHLIFTASDDKAEKTALTNPNEYAIQKGIRDAVTLLLQSLYAGQQHSFIIETKIAYFKAYYKSALDKIDSSMSSVNHLEKISTKSAYSKRCLHLQEINNEFKTVESDTMVKQSQV